MILKVTGGKPGEVLICEKHHQANWRDCPKVTTADVEASNGVVHIIDSVLLPGGPPPPAPFVGTCTKAACYFAAETPGTLRGPDAREHLERHGGSREIRQDHHRVLAPQYPF